MAAAAARRAVQHQRGPLQAMQLAADSHLRDIFVELNIPDARLKMPVSAPFASHGRQAFQDHTPWLLYPHELTLWRAWDYKAVRGYHMRNISQLVAPANNKRAFLVDTLALVIVQISPFLLSAQLFGNGRGVSTIMNLVDLEQVRKMIL